MASSVEQEPRWFAARRERAASLSRELELPSFKGNPGWEFTDLSGLDLDAYPPAENGSNEVTEVERLLEATSATHSLTQVDHHSEAQEAGGDAIVMPLDEAARAHPELVEKHLGTVVSSEDPFVARNEATLTGGAFVYVPKDTQLDAPILLTAIQSQEKHSLNWRTLIVLEEGAEAEVWEQYLSSSEETDGLFNVVTEIVVGPNAKLRFLSGQNLSEKSWIFGTQRAVVERDGTFEWVALGFGSAKGKVRMETNLAGPGADAKVTGAYAGHGRQHLDFDTTQEHAAENTVSDLALLFVIE